MFNFTIKKGSESVVSSLPSSTNARERERYCTSHCIMKYHSKCHTGIMPGTLHWLSQFVVRYITGILMRRASEASLFFLVFSRKKKPLHNGSYEYRVPKIKQKKRYSVPGMFVCSGVCVIQHRNCQLRSTILNAHGTNASPDELCTRTHTNEAFSCWFCCNSFRVDRARRGNVCLESSEGMLSYRSACPEI